MYRKQSKRYQTKKNVNKSDDKPRRSSLQVNLSYTFDLSDSENTDNSQSTVNNNCDNKNVSEFSMKNDISRILSNITDKDEALSKNCSRLRNAILNKTRELFDKQNNLTEKTAKVLGSQVAPFEDLNYCSSNSQNSKNNSVITLSPRKTRATTRRERVNSYIASNLQMNNQSINDISTIGSPIICSTFANHQCNIHESCNVRHNNSNLINCSNIPKQLSPKLRVEVEQRISPDTPKGRPSIRSIKMCNIKLNRIDECQELNKSKTLAEVSMDLTEIQGNCILNKSFPNEKNEEIKQTKIISSVPPVPSSKVSLSEDTGTNLIEDVTSNDFPKPDYSMQVNTSLDRRTNIKEQTIVETGRGIDLKRDKTIADEGICVDGTCATSDLSTGCEDFDDDVSLIQRLRNISPQPNENECVTPLQNVVGKKMNEETPGVVERTPFAMTRSMLLRTQANLNSLESQTISLCTNVSESKNNQPKSSELKQSVELEKTIVLDNTQSRIKNHGTNAPIIIQETSDDELSQTVNLIDVKNVAAKQKLRKKKLFTQPNSSGLASISPLPNDVCTPEVPKVKRLKKRRIKRNVAGRIIKTQAIVEKSQYYPMTQILPLVPSSSSSSQDFEKIRDFEKSRKKKRLVKSKKIVVKKRTEPNLLNVINKVRDRSFDGDPPAGRSPNVFMKKKQIQIKRNHSKNKIIIVSTGLCNGDKDIVKDAVRTLGEAKMELSVTRKTTHVVTTGVRTINLLRGIIRGCWLVKLDWIKESIESGKWLPAENYEIDHFSKAVKENRRDREILGNSYVPDLFALCGLIYVQNDTSPPKGILEELIKTAGGSITEEPKKSKIIIGQEGIKENWVLDSITTGELQLIKRYKR